MKRTILVLMTLVFVVTFCAEPSLGIPAWARKYKSACSDCHSSVPYLNDYGREFKELGYTLELDDYSDDLVISDDLAIGKTFPVSARFKSKFLIVPDDGNAATEDIELLDAVHEFELFAAGRLSKRWSALAELEFESSDGFAEPGFLTGSISYHHVPEFNVMLARATPFFADPYNSMADMRRLTIVKHLKHLDWKSGESNVKDERIRKPVQQINLNGRVAERVFYIAGVAAARTYNLETNDKGFRPRSGVGRLVVDVIPELSVGGFFLGGKEGDANDNDLSTFFRYGVTIDGEKNGFIYKGAFGRFEEEADTAMAGPKISNNVFHGSLAYVVLDRKDHPFVVPEIIYNNYEVNKANEDRMWQDVILSLHLYVTENVRVSAEFWRELDVPTGDDEEQTFQLGADMAF